MRFINMTNEASLNEAAQMAEKILALRSPLYADLANTKFKYSLEAYGPHYAGNILAWGPSLLRNKGGTIENPIKIFTYRPWNRFTKAVAMTNGDGAIHFNIYKLGKTSIAEKVGTILHEYAHLCGFGHGNNYKTKEKCLFSLPYYLSSNVERWL